MRIKPGYGGPMPAACIPRLMVCLMILLLPAALNAESIFMKDGSIIEGKIISENDTSYQVDTGEKKSVTIKRTKVIRITNDRGFTVKKYMKKRDGTIIEGYIVEETTEEYTVREKLESAAEFTVEKADVVSMSTEKFMSKTVYYLLGTFPGVAQVYVDKNTRGLVYMGAFIGSCGITGFAWYYYDSRHQDYLDVPRGSSQSVFDSKYDKYETASYILVGSIVLTSLVYLANWADVIWFAAPDFGKEPDETVTAGDVFYNITIGDCGRMDLIDYSGKDMRCDAAWFYGDSIVTVSAGVRF